jgi:lipoprotein-anchoring transpeptidase ErfK/SrfK
VVRRGLRRLVLPVGLILTATVGLAPAAVAATGPATTAPNEILSNETTFTTWSIADVNVVIHTQPSASSPRVAKLRTYTPDRDLQSYVLLQEAFPSDGPWVQLRIPGRPNGRTGWVPRSALDQFQVVHTQIVVNREARTLTVYRRGHRVLQVPVGVGKPSTPTPAGNFWITEAGTFLADPFYGPYAFATSDYSTLSEWPGGGVVGIHGTNEPQLIPGDPSHGCIRLRNPDILSLSHKVGIGTPLLVK